METPYLLNSRELTWARKFVSKTDVFGTPDGPWLHECWDYPGKGGTPGPYVAARKTGRRPADPNWAHLPTRRKFLSVRKFPFGGVTPGSMKRPFWNAKVLNGVLRSIVPQTPQIPRPSRSPLAYIYAALSMRPQTRLLLKVLVLLDLLYDQEYPYRQR